MTVRETLEAVAQEVWREQLPESFSLSLRNGPDGIGGLFVVIHDQDRHMVAWRHVALDGVTAIGPHTELNAHSDSLVHRIDLAVSQAFSDLTLV